MDIYLIRHGDTEKSPDGFYDAEKKAANPPLSEKGIKQAEVLAQRCKTIGLDLVVSSDFKRTMQTAERILAVSPCEYDVTPAFRKPDIGDVYQKSWDAFPELYAKWVLHETDMRPPNGENGADVWKRCKDYLDVLVTKPYKNVAVICSGGTIRSMICGVLEAPQQKRFCIGPDFGCCGMTVIRYHENDKKFLLQTFNDFTHITEAGL